MDEQRGSQKQIAKRYADRVDYYNKHSPWRRTRFWFSFIAIVGGSAAIYFAQRKAPDEFFNTGPLSSHHSNLENNCAACHAAESLTTGAPPAARFAQVLSDRFQKGAPSFERIDQACQTCHQQHAFHAPNVIENRSCSACHKEHQGPGPMQASSSLDCASCHNDRAAMQASAQKGMQLPPTHFHLNPKVAKLTPTGPKTLQLPRPREGYTAAFASFRDGHPPFQLHRENVRDTEVLRFNHQRHFAADIPAVNGKKLDCNYCHQTQSDGRYMQRVSFAANCQSCHALQFDVKNPDFELPHGDAQLARTFLRTLPAQYGELARRKRGMTNESRINEFSAQQIRQLLTQFPNAEELERSVFFTKDPYKASQQSDPATRARYAGCAYCHEVKPLAGGSYAMAAVTPPVIVDRWMPHAHFNHAKHESVSSCRDCHNTAQASRLTSDVLMPTKESCTSCHSPAGVAAKASECASCHTYHAPDTRVAAPVTASRISTKEMLLGR